MNIKQCKRCGKSFSNRKGLTCNTCLSNGRRFDLRKKVLNYFGAPKCQRCGYDKCFGALSAHHVNPSEKEFEISGNHCRSWSKIEQELSKCILICANCHMEEHHNCEKYGCPPSDSS